MSDRGTGARFRELGLRLRTLRERVGVSAVALARDVERSPSWVSRVESGEIPISEVDVLHYLARCDVSVPPGP